jgi:AcrR family transcriptional regulator
VKNTKTRAKKKRRRPHAERRQESMTLILDHAEAEFAAKGYNGTTLAGVAKIARVDTALMRYYFGDKERLFEAVFRRRAPTINIARRKALDEYRAATGGHGTLEGLLEAFTRPGFELPHGDEGYRNYAAIVAYVNSSRGRLHLLMADEFNEISQILIDDMQRLMPDVSREKLFWSYHFFTGAFTFSLGQTGRIDRLSHGVVKSSDLLGMAERLPIFVAAGIRALCRA